MCDYKERVGRKITSSLCSSEMIFRPVFDSLESDAGHFLLFLTFVASQSTATSYHFSYF